MTVLQARDLTVKIANVNICSDLNFTVKPGECWGVLGSNGAGKTTLLHALSGLYSPRSGEVYIDNQSIASLSARTIATNIGVLFQDNTDPFPTTVLESALIGRHPHLNTWQWESDVDIEIARMALHSVGLQGFDRRRVDTLSGGERRRLGIATVMVQNPDIYLLDEPNNHLDLHHQIELLSQLTALTKANEKAIIMVLHDINLASRFCDHLLLLFGDGETRHGAKHEVLDTELLERLYGHELVELAGALHRVFTPL
ncbi:MAG: ABC transporter ATP-binding protein [Gammaproteobacteria bacterium]|nr:ABC transporter ATP-binding protein [Gammaproteobacteria bacterium]